MVKWFKMNIYPSIRPKLRIQKIHLNEANLFSLTSYLSSSRLLLYIDGIHSCIHPKHYWRIYFKWGLNFCLKRGIAELVLYDSYWWLELGDTNYKDLRCILHCSCKWECDLLRGNPNWDHTPQHRDQRNVAQYKTDHESIQSLWNIQGDRIGMDHPNIQLDKYIGLNLFHHYTVRSIRTDGDYKDVVSVEREDFPQLKHRNFHCWCNQFSSDIKNGYVCVIIL